MVELDDHAEAGQPFAHVLKIIGDVAATSMDSGEARHLKRGDIVKVGDHLQSSPGGETLLQELDGGMLALRPSSELWIENFAAEGKASDHATLRLVVGGVRAITGWIGHVNQPGSTIVTPTARIGIRGTDHESFVLSQEMAEASRERVGSYDKVFSGATVMSAGNQDLILNTGHVGFVAAARPATRGLMTLSLPVLLDHVPSFYSGGTFDAQMDAYAVNAQHDSDAMLKGRLGQTDAASLSVACDATRVGKLWLSRFDSAKAHGDGAKIAALFANDVLIKATLHDAAGADTTVDLSRDEFIGSTIANMKSGKMVQQQRLTIHVTASSEHASEGCPDVTIASSVVKRGVMLEKSDRTESVQNYVLQLQQGKWLAVSGSVIQQ